MTFKEIILSCLLSYKLVVSRLLSLSWMCTLIMAWPFQFMWSKKHHKN